MQDERFTILAWSLTVVIGHAERTYTVGESFDVPRGVAHTMANMGTTATIFLWEARPALRTAQFHAAIYGSAAEGGRGSVVQLATVLQQHRQEFVLAHPPVAVQRIVFGGLALLRRLRGAVKEKPADDAEI